MQRAGHIGCGAASGSTRSRQQLCGTVDGAATPSKKQGGPTALGRPTSGAAPWPWVRPPDEVGVGAGHARHQRQVAGVGAGGEGGVEANTACKQARQATAVTLGNRVRQVGTQGTCRSQRGKQPRPAKVQPIRRSAGAKRSVSCSALGRASTTLPPARQAPRPSRAAASSPWPPAAAARARAAAGLSASATLSGPSTPAWPCSCPPSGLVYAPWWWHRQDHNQESILLS